MLVVDLASGALEEAGPESSASPRAEIEVGDDGVILLVADGVGGRAGGAEASRRAAREVERSLTDSTPDNEATPERFIARLLEGGDHSLVSHAPYLRRAVAEWLDTHSPVTNRR